MVANYKTSKELFEQSLKFQEKYFGINHVKVADTLNSLGLLYMKIGKHQDSQQVLERALQIQEKSLDSNHIKVADTLYVLAELHSKTCNHQAAKKFLERSLQIHKKYFGADHKKVKRTMDAWDVISSGIIWMRHAGTVLLAAERAVVRVCIRWALEKV